MENENQHITAQQLNLLFELLGMDRLLSSEELKKSNIKFAIQWGDPGLEVCIEGKIPLDFIKLLFEKYNIQNKGIFTGFYNQDYQSIVDNDIVDDEFLQKYEELIQMKRKEGLSDNVKKTLNQMHDELERRPDENKYAKRLGMYTFEAALIVIKEFKKYLTKKNNFEFSVDEIYDKRDPYQSFTDNYGHHIEEGTLIIDSYLEELFKNSNHKRTH